MVFIVEIKKRTNSKKIVFFILVVILEPYTNAIDTIVKPMQKEKQMESINLKKVTAIKPILHNGAK